MRFPWDFAAISAAALLSHEFIGLVSGGVSLLLGTLAVYFRRQEQARAARNRRAAVERRRLDDLYAQLLELEERLQRRCQQVTELEQDVQDAQDESSCLKAQIAEEVARYRLAETMMQGECNQVQAPTALTMRLSDERSRCATLASALEEERQCARNFCTQMVAERREASGASKQLEELSQRAATHESCIRKESERVSTLQQRLRETELEAERGMFRVTELVEHVQTLKARISEHPMAQFTSWFGLTAGVSAQDVQALQPIDPDAVQLCQDSLAREAIQRATDRAFKLSLELRELERYAAETQDQREELHCQCETLRREAEDLSDDINVQRSILEKRRFDSEQAEDALREERRRCQVLADELHAAQFMARPRDAVESVGQILKDTIYEEPAATRPAIKAKLLNCFHPGKNPAADVATRITRMLESMD